MSIQMTDVVERDEMLRLTVEIVSAYVSNNTIAMHDVPQLIEQVHGKLGNLGEAAPAPQEKLQPAVPVKKSVTPDFIICLEDGKKLKMLKRHLKTAYDMTPEEYREKFANPFIAAHRGYIDDVIMPHDTRRRVGRAFAMLRNKKLENPWKKHGNIPL